VTKIVTLRLSIACDDAVELKHLKPAIAAIIGAQGTVAVKLNGGEAEARIHYGTVEVLQGPERVPGRGAARRGRGQTADQVGMSV
jgi:hypothetical protein